MLVNLTQVSKEVTLPDTSKLEILNNIELQLGEGEHLSIVGRSGSGKSTLLNILGLLDSPTSGMVIFADVDIRKVGKGALDRLRGRNIGYVFQQFNLLSGLNALENVMMPLGYASGAQFWRRRTIAADMLDRVGLSHRLDSYPDQLSGGEQQRVAIARALVRQPRMILADEPTGALDLETGQRVMSILETAAKENSAALVTITHDPNVAARAVRRLRLEHGRLWEEERNATAATAEAADTAEAALPH